MYHYSPLLAIINNMALVGAGHKDMPSKKRKGRPREDDADSSKKLRGEKRGLNFSDDIVSDQTDLSAMPVYQHNSDGSAGPDHHNQSIFKRKSDEFDLKDPFWKYFSITGALKRSAHFLENH